MSHNHQLLIHDDLPSLPYDTLNDLVGITPLASLPNVMVVSPSKGYKDIKDLIAKLVQTAGIKAN